MMNVKEQQYSSSTSKLLMHGERFEEWHEGLLRPITLQLAPTDKCNMNPPCAFCSVENRAGDEMHYKQIEKAVRSLHKLGLKAVEITGGGDPTCYSHINHVISYCHGLGLDVGMITNGVALTKIKQENLDKLTWLRISMQALDYGRQTIQIPKIKGDLSFSYIWSEISKEDIIDKLQRLAEKHDVKFIRIAPNCLSTAWIEHFRKTIPVKVAFRNRFFAQTKSYEKPKSCIYGYIKPFLAPDGKYYHCSAIPLHDGVRAFHESGVLGEIGEEDLIWGTLYIPKDTKECGLCFFKDQNELIQSVMIDVPHKNFV